MIFAFYYLDVIFVIFLHSIQKINDYGVALLVLMALTFLPSGFITYLIEERKKEEKQVQLVTGVSKSTYWFATVVWDLMVILFALAIFAGVFLAFGISTFTAQINLLASLLLIFSFWICSASIVYLIEGVFDEPSMGQLVVLCTNMIIGLGTLAVTLILQMMWWVQVSEVIFRNFYELSRIILCMHFLLVAER